MSQSPSFTPPPPPPFFFACQRSVNEPHNDLILQLHVFICEIYLLYKCYSESIDIHVHVHSRASHSQRARVSELKSTSSKLLIWILRTAGETPLGVGLVHLFHKKGLNHSSWLLLYLPIVLSITTNHNFIPFFVWTPDWQMLHNFVCHMGLCPFS